MTANSDPPPDWQLGPLSAETRCCILSDPHGTIIIVHDKDIQSELQWVEYDRQDQTLSLIHDEGQIQDLGIRLNDAMRQNISQGCEITLVKLENGKLQDEQRVVLVIKNYEG
ncbi:MAG: hypothetical protein KA099_07395 [Alphaproteobacteria bacterium]|jgi:hypothetical protein|nr:hypothetical protein [Alphaproteobacteria bacterium]MBP7758306.1 hypothetical protein [Alphaproteobacteria bacterium]MBP7761551.1 hypothetical protein [Alphaproteobacteria bacterium]MBP7905136.1 hypothetical protein [Alphaproteobacteria bacterium]